MAKKKTPLRICSQCGTRFRPPKTICPRGTACIEEEKNHLSLMQRIAAQEKRK